MAIHRDVVLSSFYEFATMDRHVAKEWERFQRGERVRNSRSLIISSWKRSKKYNVNPKRRLADIVYCDERLREQREESKLLLDIAERHIDQMFEKFGDEEVAVTLSNHKGIILFERTLKRMWPEMENHHFLSGADWSEEKVGTNAIGTALVEQKPVQIFSSEHFCEGWHPWICSSSPIKDPVTKQVLGVLNVTGAKHLLSAHNIDFVINYAKKIEQHIGYYLLQNELSPLYSLFNTIHTPVLIYDLKGEVKQYNRAAKHLLNISLGENICRVRELQDTEVNKFLDYKTIKGIHLQGQVWDVNIYSYKYGERFLGNMAILEKKSSNTLFVQKNRTRYSFENIVTKAPHMDKVIEHAKKAAFSKLNTIVYGETGTGKELLVQSIHEYGPRKNQPFVAVNCGAIPKDLIASELFGYEAGAFTGAKAKGKKGKFLLANGGTLFLDEISELPLQLQQYLLRVLEEKEVTPIGAENPIPIDVRIICATNKDLQKEVEKGNFREDLYYRLNVIRLELPPLRERKLDIPYLATYFAKESFSTISEAAMEKLIDYSWPGNIRQLKNVIEQAVFNADRRKITVDVLPKEVLSETKEKTKTRAKQIDEQLLRQTLEENDGNITQTAKQLSVSRMTIYRKKEEFSID